MMRKCKVLLATCVIVLSGCVGFNPIPRFIAPDMDNVVKHTLEVSDNIVNFSLPKGHYQSGFQKMKANVDIDAQYLYTGGPSSALAEFQWNWQPRTNVNGTLKMSVWMARREEIETKDNTLKEIYLTKLMGNIEVGERYRIKDKIQYVLGGPHWFRWDGFLGEMSEDMEVFIYPLDNEHYLRVQFIAIDNSHGNPDNQEWYAQAEDMVDQIMASIQIDSGAEVATIPYGVPDLGLVDLGTLKYFDDISVR